MFGQRAIKSEALKKSGIGLNAAGNFSQGLPLSHLAQQFALVLIKTGRIFMILAPADQRQTESHARVYLCVS
jgi:hypothetical protein